MCIITVFPTIYYALARMSAVITGPYWGQQLFGSNDAVIMNTGEYERV